VKRWERWTFNAAALVVVVTGLVYAWMKYLVENPDPYAVVNHPWEATILHVHVLASPPFILIFGVILNSHIIRKLGASRLPNRTSGYLSLGLFVAMVATGYLLQTATAAAWLTALVAVHVGSGALFAVTYATHLIVSARLARRRPVASRILEVA
jgi:hypothetical protein